MTKPEDQPPGHEPVPQPSVQPSVPSWVDEVLRVQARPQPVVMPGATEAGDETGPPAVPPGPASDLRLPEGPPAPAPAAQSVAREDDWIAHATGNAARNPAVPGGPQVVSPLPGGGQEWLQPARPGAPSGVPADTAQKKLVAGLLGIVLGSLGVHKFYLGMNTPGLIMLGVNVGVWILALLLGLLTLGFGLILTVPLAALVSGAVGLLGLVEGVLYLTKSDEEFYGQYVLGKKPWL